MLEYKCLYSWQSHTKLHKQGVLVVSIIHPLRKSFKYTEVYNHPNGTHFCCRSQQWEWSEIGSKFSHFCLWQTDGQTDLNALNNFSCREDKLSFKKNCTSLALVVLEKKSVTRTRTDAAEPWDYASWLTSQLT